MHKRCCDVTFSCIFIAIVIACSVGMYDSTGVDYQSCYVTSGITKTVCVKHYNPNSGDYYDHYLEYDAYIPAYNLSTTGAYYCNKDNCSICVGVESMKIGALKECYTAPFQKPYYVFENGQNVDGSKTFLILSSLGFAGIALGTALYVKLRFFRPEEYQSIN